MPRKKKTPERARLLLETLVETFTTEDRAVRERQLRIARGLKLFWDGFQTNNYNEVAHDWRVWDQQQYQDSNFDQAYYDNPVNVFRAYLESIIAALSVTVPPIKCYPDDAENSLDIATARAGDKIAELISRHNDSSLLWLHALFIYCTEPLLASYTYPKADKDYGTYKEDEYEDSVEMHEYKTCPNCGAEMDDKLVTELEKDEYMPDDEDVILHDIIFNEGEEICNSCAAMVDPEIRRSPLTVTRIVGTTQEAKSRQCMEAYGALNVKVPVYARKQKECPYLMYMYEIHYSLAIGQWEHLRDKFTHEPKIGPAAGGSFDPYERWARLPTQYYGEYPMNTVTVKKTWLRPDSFNTLGDKKDIDYLKSKYPDGAQVTQVNDEFAEACNEALDDCWSLCYNPLADYVHSDPAGLLLVSIQSITNDLISLTLQTIEHGIPQTFADPTVLDFKAYKQLEVAPGAIVPTKKILGGRSIGEAFYEVKTASLSPEVIPFSQNVQQLGQLASGSLPSLFGGQMQQGSGTASEYSMSRAQALQRLQNVWKMLTVWWKNSYGKAIASYIKEVKDDEKDVQRKKDGSFVNVFIRKAELEGKIGKIELEANENLPMSWNQRKDMVFQLLMNGNPELLSIMGSPENLPIIREALGLTDFYVPGEDQRNQQYEEITELLNSEPIQMPPDPQVEMAASMGDVTAQQLLQQSPQEVPSVEIDPIYNNHEIHFEIISSWVSSEQGRLAKIENAKGYKNVLLHGMQHKQQIDMLQMQQTASQNEATGAAPNKKPNKRNDRPAPIQGEEDVRTAQ